MVMDLCAYWRDVAHMEVLKTPCSASFGILLFFMTVTYLIPGNGSYCFNFFCSHSGVISFYQRSFNNWLTSLVFGHQIWRWILWTSNWSLGMFLKAIESTGNLSVPKNFPVSNDNAAEVGKQQPMTVTKFFFSLWEFLFQEEAPMIVSFEKQYLNWSHLIIEISKLVKCLPFWCGNKHNCKYLIL